MYPDSAIALANPLATARACLPVNFTGAYFSAFFAARRSALSCWRCATERRSLVLVALPKKSSSQDLTKSYQEPRGSLGNQNPEAVKMMGEAKTMASSGL